jgi:hypothetical protein
VTDEVPDEEGHRLVILLNLDEFSRWRTRCLHPLQVAVLALTYLPRRRGYRPRPPASGRSRSAPGF